MAVKTRDTIEIIGDIVALMTPIVGIKDKVDNGDNTYTLSILNTYWIQADKKITIDAKVYRVLSFVINESITIEDVTSGAGIPTVDFFQLPDPLFVRGKTAKAAQEQGHPKDEVEKTPFIWVYEPLKEKTITDRKIPWGRQSNPRMFFMNEADSKNWSTDQQVLNVGEPMRQMVELFFALIEKNKNKYKQVLDYEPFFRANWGKVIADKGSDKRFFNEDLTGYEVSFDFTMSKTVCDDRQPVIVCTLAAIVATTGETGEGLNDGTAQAINIGGFGLITYAWTGPGGFTSTLKEIDNLVPGVYEVTVTDSNGCQSKPSGIVQSSGGAGCNLVALVSTTNESSAGADDGTASVVTGGGTGVITFAWTGPNSFTSTDQNLINLEPGLYEVTATDENACEADASGTVGAITPCAIAITGIDVVGTTNEVPLGTVTVNTSGGTGTLHYLWGNGQITQTATNLPTGLQTVVVTDAGGGVPCVALDDTIIPVINGNFVTFDGNNDKITFSTISVGINENFTIQLEVKPTSLGASLETIIGGAGSTSIGIFGDDVIIVKLAGAANLLFSIPTLVDGTFYRIVITRNVANVRVYVNGVQSTTGSLIRTSAFVLDTFGVFSGGGFNLGAGVDNSGVNVGVAADQIRVDAMNANPANFIVNMGGDVNAFWSFNSSGTSTTLVDSSGNGNDGTLVNFISEPWSPR